MNTPSPVPASNDQGGGVHISSGSPAVPARKPRPPRQSKTLLKGARVEEFEPKVRQTAAYVLEVLAGVRTPEDAAHALQFSLPTYYNVEMRALRGLIAGCGPAMPGRTMVMANKLKGAEHRIAQLEQQVQRYQALLRAAQRGVGIAAPEPAPPKVAGKRRRKPRARALRAAAAIRGDERAAPPPQSPPAT